MLASAERPVILAGGGVLRARTSTDLLRFAELLQVPIIAGWRRADVVSNDHPLYLGMAGIGAAPSVRERLLAADAMLVIGCRLSEPTSWDDTIPASGTRWASVDIEPHASHGPRPADLTVVADARTFLRAANDRLVGRAVLDAEKVRRRQANNDVDRAAWEAASIVDADADAWTGPGVHPGRVVTTLRQVLPDDAILTTDAGNFAGWAGRGFRFRRPGTFIGPTSGAMGYAVPAAIAAALVHRDRPVVALAGDGGMAMTMAELETATREGIRIIVLVFDNERYGTIRMWQARRGSGEGVGTELGPVDFAAIARGLGARGDPRRARRRPGVRTSPGSRRGPLDGDPARGRPRLGLGRPARDGLITAARSGRERRQCRLGGPDRGTDPRERGAVRSHERRLVWRSERPPALRRRPHHSGPRRPPLGARPPGARRGRDRSRPRAEGRHPALEPIDEAARRSVRRSSGKPDATDPTQTCQVASRCRAAGSAAMPRSSSRSAGRIGARSRSRNSVHLRGGSGLTADGVALSMQGAAVRITDVRWSDVPDRRRLGSIGVTIAASSADVDTPKPQRSAQSMGARSASGTDGGGSTHGSQSRPWSFMHAATSIATASARRRSVSIPGMSTASASATVDGPAIRPS